MTTPISVVIAARNAESTIGQQLAALVGQAWPHGGEIIVADNGSTDATAEVAERHNQPENVPVRVIDASDQRGAGHARNVGVALSQYETIGFCDADDVVDHRWVAEIAAATATTPAVGGRLDFELLNAPWIVGSRGRLLASEELPLFDGVFPVLSSCNLGVQRGVFESLGGFDTSYLRGQDAEFSLRLHERAVATGFARDAIVHYRMRSSVQEIYDQAKGWGEAQVGLRAALAETQATPNRHSTFRSWMWLVSRVPMLCFPTGRARWAYVAGTRVGTARGHRLDRRRTPVVTPQ